MLSIPAFGHTPVVESGARVAPNATVIGDVTVETKASIWYGAVLRGDNSHIHIGAETCIQDNAVVHSPPSLPVTVGKQTTVGHSAILHGCTVGDRCLIGMGSTLMNGCVIGDQCLIGSGSLVTQGTVIPPRSLVVGAPAKVKRPLTQEELDSLDESCQDYLKLSVQLEEIK